MTNQQAIRMALEALEIAADGGGVNFYEYAKELRQYLEQQPADPVVGTKTWFEGGKMVTQELKYSEVYKQPAAWVGLTDEEIWNREEVDGYDFARAIEAKLKEKNT